MAELTLAARLILAAVFAVAGVAKLIDQDGARQGVRAFAVPGPVVAPVAALLPVAELGVAIALFITPAAAAGALGALVLLAVFLAGIALSLSRGGQPDCRCFGQIHSAPVSWKTLARNAVLAAMAVFVVADGPGTSLGAWSSGVTGTEWLEMAVAVVLTLAFVLEGSWRRERRRLGRERLGRLRGGAAEEPLTDIPPSSPGLPVGTAAPHFSLPDGEGNRVSLDDLRVPGRPVLLIFTKADCGACRALRPDIQGWQEDHRAEVTIAVISRGPLDAAGPVKVLLAAGDNVAHSYRALDLPSAVLIGTDGAVASRLVVGADPIRGLVQTVLGARLERGPAG